MFIGDSVIVVAFVGDILFWSTYAKFINALGMKLKEQDVLLEEEDGAPGFLGDTMARNNDGSIEMKQVGLID
jgi:hypothetical protein